MKEAAENLEFEEAARLRDEVKKLEAGELGIGTSHGKPKGRSLGGKPGTRTKKAKSHRKMY